MWKDSYCIGVDKIDSQHRALFEMASQLILVIRENQDWESQKNECRQSIVFLKKYVVEHFREEEKYQKEIGYEEFAEHQKLHQDFTKDVIEYEKKLEKSSFDSTVIKQFVGMLTAWLIYHVADADQKITAVKQPAAPHVEKSMLQWYLESICQVLHTMVNVDTSPENKHTPKEAESFGDLLIALDITGDLKGSILFGYSKEFAIEMMKKMTSMEMTELDEMVCSAMSEVSNIISGNAATIVKENGHECDITPPRVLRDDAMKENSIPKNAFIVETPIGGLAVAAQMEF